MRFLLRPFTAADADEVATWRYPAPYDVYDWAEEPPSDAELAETSEPLQRWLAVDDAEAGALVGFCELHLEAGEAELGLGMRPDLTGRGLGPSFVSAILEEVRDRWSPERFAFDVLPWNERAIRAYERVGFVRGDVYVRRFPEGTTREFLRMTRLA
jgi:ribosomal-protein-alanine N-acetyltransferase